MFRLHEKKQPIKPIFVTVEVGHKVKTFLGANVEQGGHSGHDSG